MYDDKNPNRNIINKDVAGLVKKPIQLKLKLKDNAKKNFMLRSSVSFKS